MENLADVFGDASSSLVDVLAGLGFSEPPRPSSSAARLPGLLSKAKYELDIGDVIGAEQSFRELITLLPLDATTWATLGVLLTQQKKLAEALPCFTEALALEPTAPLYRQAFAEYLLRSGDLLNGFCEFESNNWAPPPANAERWDGKSSLRGRSIVIGGANGGLGDVLMLSRYIPMLKKEHGASRVLLCMNRPYFSRLCGVIETVQGLDEICPEGSIPEADYCAPILSLPFLLNTELRTIPANLPYLSPPESEIAAVQKALDGIGSPKVGLCWHGSVNPNQQWNSRSIPPVLLSPLMNIPGVTMFNLQGGASRRDSFPGSESMLDLSDDPQTLRRDAALISELDLIITIDTMTAHLAGALGKPTWVMLPYFACWRWMENRNDSPWYPGVMRLFRQERPGDWEGVIQQVKQALLQRASEFKRIAR